jgi:hypothetical protein
MKVLPGAFVLLVLSTILIFSSCQKEIDWGFSNKPQGDSSYLSKYIFMDTTLPAGSDTVTKAFLSYDNSKRLSTIQAYNVGTIDSFTYNFRYNGADSLPFLIIERGTGYNGPATSYIDSILLTYNNAKVKTDSVIQWIYPANSYDGTTVRTSLISGNVVKVFERDYGDIGGVITLLNFDSALYNVSYSSGNLSSAILFSGAVAFYQSVSATYDNKRNPFGKIIKFSYNSFENEIFNEWNIQRNNPLQVQYQHTFPPSNSEQYTYIYRTDGYPVSSTFFETVPFSNFNKVLYSYISL